MERMASPKEAGKDAPDRREYVSLRELCAALEATDPCTPIQVPCFPRVSLYQVSFHEGDEQRSNQVAPHELRQWNYIVPLASAGGITSSAADVRGILEPYLDANPEACVGSDAGCGSSFLLQKPLRLTRCFVTVQEAGARVLCRDTTLNKYQDLEAILRRIDSVGLTNPSAIEALLAEQCFSGAQVFRVGEKYYSQRGLRLKFPRMKGFRSNLFGQTRTIRNGDITVLSSQFTEGELTKAVGVVEGSLEDLLSRCDMRPPSKTRPRQQISGIIPSACGTRNN